MMRVVDFLVLLTGAHAEALGRLEQLFGEEVVVTLLERTAEKSGSVPRRTATLPSEWLMKDEVKPQVFEQAESECASLLRTVISQYGLPEALVFHLWGYPPFRQILDSGTGISHRLIDQSENVMAQLGQMAVLGAEEWLDSLELPEPYRTQARGEVIPVWERLEDALLARLTRGH